MLRRCGEVGADRVVSREKKEGRDSGDGRGGVLAGVLVPETCFTTGAPGGEGSSSTTPPGPTVEDT